MCWKPSVSYAVKHPDFTEDEGLRGTKSAALRTALTPPSRSLCCTPSCQGCCDRGAHRRTPRPCPAEWSREGLLAPCSLPVGSVVTTFLAVPQNIRGKMSNFHKGHMQHGAHYSL